MASAIALTPTTLPGYVEQVAPKYGLDPAAVLAVAHEEGLGGGIGDSGTSFGPWQLHAGGALPSQEYQGPNSPVTQQWAWSSSGVDYALAQMQSVAQGLSGAAAIEAIVTDFERPASPAKEIQGAESAYGTYKPGTATFDASLNLLPGVGGGLFSIGEGAYQGGKQAASDAISGVLEYVVRGGLLIGAFAFGALALVLLVRAFTGKDLVVVPGALGKAVEVATPTGRAVRAATRESRIASVGAGAARERRVEESHQARLKTQAARTTEVRARSRNRTTRTRKEREAEFNRGYVERATEEASQNLNRARRQNRKEV